MSAVLERFERAARARSLAEEAEHPLSALEELIERLPAPRPFAMRVTRMAGPEPRVIAELKRASPSAGLLRPDYRPLQIARGFTRVGAAAVSVLTEPDEFLGDISHLSEVRPAHLPVLRKDFLLSPYQVAQSRAAGADAVLLIASLLTGPALGVMLEATRRYGLDALVEVHDAEEIARAVDAGANLIGVNNRDLRTLTVDIETCLRLAEKLPAGVVKVAESGIRGRGQIDRLMAAGYEAFLIGEELMRAADPGDALWRMLQPES